MQFNDRDLRAAEEFGGVTEGHQDWNQLLCRPDIFIKKRSVRGVTVSENDLMVSAWPELYRQECLTSDCSLAALPFSSPESSASISLFIHPIPCGVIPSRSTAASFIIFNPQTYLHHI